jgi:2-dehydro-3-deoxyphosphogluconate aldolase/(4S)-4-hydroxy-2-oxoglutarate aldolase
MHPVLESLGKNGLIPVITIERAADAEPLAAALEEGGLPVAEVTFRTQAGRESIARIARSNPGILLGAGTVLTVDQARAACEAGAKYIVSPGFSRKVVEYCLGVGIPEHPEWSHRPRLRWRSIMGWNS